MPLLCRAGCNHDALAALAASRHAGCDWLRAAPGWDCNHDALELLAAITTLAATGCNHETWLRLLHHDGWLRGLLRHDTTHAMISLVA